MSLPKPVRHRLHSDFSPEKGYEMSAWLSLPFLNNPLQSWLLALGWLVLVVVLVSVIKPILVSWISALASHTSNHWDDALVNAVQGTRLPLAALIGLYPAVQSLSLPDTVGKWVLGLAAVALFLQIGLWVSRFLDFWIRVSRERAISHDPETATGLAAMSFIARLVLWSLVFLLLLDNLGFNVTTLLAGLGVGGIAVGLALQNILGDLFSSLSIVLDKPFQIGRLRRRRQLLRHGREHRPENYPHPFHQRRDRGVLQHRSHQGPAAQLQVHARAAHRVRLRRDLRHIGRNPGADSSSG
jgi:hypothetical protein